MGCFWFGDMANKVADEPISRNKDTDVENKGMEHQEGKARDELGDWDWHICRIETMDNTDN